MGICPEFEFVLDPDHRHFGNRSMGLDRFLDFPGAQAMAGDVDDVVGAPEDGEVTFVILDRPVEGRIDQGIP